jgi:hypothetical protein
LSDFWNYLNSNQPPPPPVPQQPQSNADGNDFWDYLDNPQPQPPQYQPQQPAPVYAYPNTNTGDFWGYLDNPQPQQQPPQYQYQPKDPFQLPDVWGTLNSVVGNAAQGAGEQTGYFDNVWQGLANPWEAPDKADMAPWEWFGGNVSRVAGSALGGFSEAVKPAGGWVDELANSNIPFVDPLAEATRWTWENVAEPLFSATPALIGTLAESVDTNNSVNPFDWRYNRNAARQGWDENDPEQVYQRVYQSELASGKHPQQAEERAAREREKMYNPLNRAFRSGVEEFATLNPAFQLGVSVADPVQNLAGRAFIGKPLEYAGKGLGKVSDVTGVPRAFSAIDKKLEGPQKFDATIARENYFAEQHVADAEAALPDTVDPAQRPYVARTEVFENPNSEFYWEKVGIDPQVAEGAQYMLQARRQADAEAAPDAAFQPGETRIADTQSDFARQVQDTTNPTPRPVSKDPFSLPGDETVLKQGEPTEALAAVTARVPSELDEFFPESTRRAAVEAQRPPVEIPDYVKAIGIPAREALHGEFLSAVQQKLGFEKKAYKLSGTKGNKPYLVPTKPLEQFGIPGKIINALGFTMPFMTRAFLNNSGRAVRDTIGNLVKYTAEGFGLDRSTNPRFERITGSKATAPLGRASIAAEVGKESMGKDNFATAAFYHVINPFNELSSDLLRTVTRGKYKNWNDLTEKNETGLKTFAYKREFLKRFDAAVDSRVRAGQLAPELADHIKAGTLTPETLQDWIKGQMPRGSSLADALAKKYNPLNVSDSVRSQLNRVLAGHGGPAGEVLRTALNTLQTRLDASNAAKRAQYEAALARMDRRPTRDPRKAENRRKTLQAVWQQAQPDHLEDITPDHPIWKAMEKDVLDNLTVAQKAAEVVEQADPVIKLAVRNQIFQTLQWAAKDGNLRNLKRVLARDIDRRESSFKQYEKQAEITPQPQPQVQTQPPAASPVPATQRPVNHVGDIAALKKEVLTYGKLPNRSYTANRVLQTIAGKGKPGEVVVRYQKEGATHFRTTAPDKLRDGEQIAWPEQVPDQSQPAPPPQAPAVQMSSNPDVAYQKRAAVERNLRDLLFKEGKRPKAVDELRNSPLKGRTSDEYMAALWEAARKDGLSEDGVWQAAGQQRPAPPDPLSDFSQGARYHGTSEAFDELKPGYDYDQSRNLYGPGLYTTDNLDVARSYTRKGGGTNPQVYKVDWTGPDKPNLLNLEKPFPPELQQGITYFFSDDSVGFRPEFDWAKPAKDLYGDFKQALLDREGSSLTTQEAQEILYNLADQFKAAGYDGFSHVGGSKAGKGKVEPHNVAVLFDPKDFEAGNKVSLSKHEEPAATTTTTATPPFRNGIASGWKLHLAVDPANINAVDAVLQDLKAKGEVSGYKQGSNSGQDGKDFTVYVGGKAQAQAVADALNQRAGSLLDTPRGDPLVDDASFGGKVMGRFDANDNEFHQYGTKGVPYTKEDMAQKVWGNVTPGQARAKADALLRSKYGEFYSGEPAAQAATPVPTPATTPQTPGPDLATLDRAVNNPAVRRLPVDDGYGNILTPDQARKMLAKWNRTATFKTNGDVFNGPLTPEQRAQYRRDLLATDEYYRQASGNTFRLDLDTFSPVRIEDGVSLDELVGRSRPGAIGELKPEWPKDFPADMDGTLKAVEKAIGPDAYKTFAEMKRAGDQAGIEMAYSDIARAMGFPDPTEVRTASGKIGMETDQARAYLKMLADDARQRKQAADTAQTKADTDQETTQKQAELLAQHILAERSKIVGEAGRGAYGKIERTFFDYQNKNVLDQAVGSLLPFGYWSRRNFAYVARYFAAHPAQFAAVLNFYKNIEAQNREAGGIPDYALGNLLLWTNPDGSKVLWNFNTALPFNPLGDGESMLQLIGPDDDSKSANKTPLAIAFGADRRNSKGEVTGRDKGILSTFLRPNPVVDILTKTGKVNDVMKDLGWVTDGFGSPDPSDLRGQRQTVGLIPGRTQIRDISARLGITQFLRTELGKAGIKLTDLDLEGPINNLLFGTNAGKPLTAVYNELTEMAQGDPKNKDKYLMALARLKEGNWTPEALKALDTVEAQTAWQRAASLAGFSSVITNTPREQLAGALYSGYGQVAGDKGHYEVTATDPKTGYQTRKYIPGESSKFFENNAGANVLFAKNKEPGQIVQGVEDDKTRVELDKVYKSYDNGEFDLRTRNRLIDDLRRGNPTYFKVAKDKDYQQAKGELPTLLGEAKQSVQEVDKKYFKSENPTERGYSEWKDDLFRAGGDRYQELSDQISKLYDQKRNKEAYALSQSKEYLAAKTKRDAIQKAHPDFAARYKAENEAKYGPSKPASTGGNTGSSAGSGARSASTYRASYSAPRRYTSAKTTRKTTTAKKTYTTQNRSTNTSTTNTKNKTVTSPSAPYTPAQKAAYAKALKAKPGNIAYAQAAARNAGSSSSSAGNRTPSTGAKSPWYLPPTKIAAPAAPLSTAVSRPAALPATTGSQNEWTPAQKQKYAQLRAAGKSTAYAAKAANNMAAGSQNIRTNSQVSIDTPNTIRYSVSQNSNATTNSAPVYRPQTPYMIPIHISGGSSGSSHRGTMPPKPPKPVKSRLRLPTLGKPKIYDSRLG